MEQTGASDAQHNQTFMTFGWRRKRKEFTELFLTFCAECSRAKCSIDTGNFLLWRMSRHLAKYARATGPRQIKAFIVIGSGRSKLGRVRFRSPPWPRRFLALFIFDLTCDHVMQDGVFDSPGWPS